MQDWIGLYENALDSSVCNQLISLFDSSENKRNTGTGVTSNQSSIRRGQSVQLTQENDGALFNTVTAILQKCYTDYANKYIVLTKQQAGPEAIAIYKYKDDSEFYGWHTDAADPGLRYRFVSVVGYLNDVESGGETEFMYLGKKVKPKEGNILLFPSGWTHYHQALPPKSNSKYVLITWIRYTAMPLL